MKFAAIVSFTRRVARHAPGWILLTSGLFFSWFWATEVWARQEWMFKVNEHHLLAAGVIGLLAGFGFISTSLRASFRRKLSFTLLAGGLTFAAIFGLAHLLSVRSLWREARAGEYRADADYPWYAGIQTRWDDFVIEKFYDKPVHPTWRRYNYRDESTDHLVETSRWRVRKAFILRIAGDEDKALLAIYNWHWLFPAIIGQDVALARRQELLHEFAQLSRREDVPGPCRDVMLLWMGLIVLTDHEAFAEHRVAIRDAMLTRENPSFAMTGDVWMRVLNSLLAFDPPESRAGLVARFAQNPEMLRRAVRESLRGIEEQSDAILSEISRLDKFHRTTEAAALWLDLLNLYHQPKAPPAPPAVLAGLHRTMTEWLMEDSSRVRERFSPPKDAIQIHQVSGDDFRTTLPEECQDLLAGHAEGLLKKIARGTTWIPSEDSLQAVEIEHLLMIRQFLDDGRRKSMVNALVPLLDEQLVRLVNHDMPIELRERNINETAAAFLHIWEEIDEGHRGKTRETVRKICGMEPNLREFSTRTTKAALSQFLLLVWDSCPDRKIGQLDRILARSMSPFGGSWLYRRWWGRFGATSDAHEFTTDEVGTLTALLARVRDLTTPSRNQVGEGPDGFIFWRHDLHRLARWEHTFWEFESDLSIKDKILFHLVHERMLPLEFLPEGWQQVVASATGPWQVEWDHPDEAFWAPQVATAAMAEKTLSRFNDRNDFPLIPLVEYLARHPPTPDVRQTIWKHFHRWLASGERWQKVTACRVMLILMGWLEPEERAGFRQLVDQFFVDVRPSLGEWSHTMMLTMNPENDFPRFYAISSDECRSEWIPWADDALSARLSWSSQIHHELNMLYHAYKLSPNDGLFMYLTNHIDACGSKPCYVAKLCEPVPARARRGAPPDLPFARTPWQRARELYLKRPDLEFPDRVMFRPHHQW